jgi:hypothetical protein
MTVETIQAVMGVLFCAVWLIVGYILVGESI